MTKSNITAEVVAENTQLQRESLQAHRDGAEVFYKGIQMISDSVNTYRDTLAPSIIAVTDRLDSCANKQLEAAQLNAKSWRDVVDRIEAQEDRHREELKQDRERQDRRDDRHFQAVDKLTGEVKEFSKICSENNHQVATLTEAVKDQCKLTTETRKDLNDLQIKFAEQSATANTKWGAFHIIGVIIGGAIATGLITLLISLLNSTPKGG